MQYLLMTTNKYSLTPEQKKNIAERIRIEQKRKGLSDHEAALLKRRIIYGIRNPKPLPPLADNFSRSIDYVGTEAQATKTGRPWKRKEDRLTSEQALNLLQFVRQDKFDVFPKMDLKLRQFLMNCHAIGVAACTAMFTIWLGPGVKISQITDRIKLKFSTDTIGKDKRKRHPPHILWAREFKDSPLEGTCQAEHFHLVVGWSNHDTKLDYVLACFAEMQKVGLILPDIEDGICGWKVSTTKEAKRRLLYIATAWELREAYRHYCYLVKDDGQKDRDDDKRGVRFMDSTRLKPLYRPPSPEDQPMSFTFTSPYKKPGPKLLLPWDDHSDLPPLVLPSMPRSPRGGAFHPFEIIDYETGEIIKLLENSPFKSTDR
jgi:hypothetical protein